MTVVKWYRGRDHGKYDGSAALDDMAVDNGCLVPCCNGGDKVKVRLMLMIDLISVFV